MKARHRLSVLMVAAALIGVTACGSDAEPRATAAAGASSEAAAPAPPAATGPTPAGSADTVPTEGATITIADFEYVMPETIAPGTTVTVVNEDDAPHTVTAKDDGGFDVDVAAGETATFTAPDEAGEYAVICVYHPAMSGTLVVG